MNLDLLFNELVNYLVEGGFVMPPLVLATCLLWYGLGDRLLILRRGLKGDLGLCLQSGKVPHGGPLGEAYALMSGAADARWQGTDLVAHFEERLFPIRQGLDRHRIMVKSIVIVAPLAGLLGTVGGMIETFDALGDGALFAASGGVAGGISQALLTTQMGLVVAIPGVIIGRILDRRQARLEDDLDQMVAIAVMAPERFSP